MSDCGRLAAGSKESRRLLRGGSSMHPIYDHMQAITRRHFFRRGALGLGTAALASLLPAKLQAAEGKPAFDAFPGLPHFAPKAKRAIYLFTNGGPSQMDLWDYKPKMNDLFDKDLP